ncbi:hypothetical protein [Rhodospira trueperi]|uniref:Phage DNA packaging protein, Nu1 subunit of terminase n=1 Tax=Rhodospira trueperi TaxID=69960 RepID=A0A1G7GYH5_9PROT|nr:hypothetical protein [Rhodospira trueperi]SDE93187.1 hypothetical protein SAMN05421720_11658 [Rhodospira trueperi]
MQNQDEPHIDLDGAVITKAEFARRLGVSRGRVSQLVQAGMPTREGGKLDEAEARAWYAANIDPSRRRGCAVVSEGALKVLAAEMPPSGLRNGPHGAAPSDLTTWRTEHERLKAEERAMRLARERGETLPKADVARLFGDLGRHHRETWSQFPTRVAPLLAAEFGVSEPAMLHALETHVRNQLSAMVEAPPEVFADAG